MYLLFFDKCVLFRHQYLLLFFVFVLFPFFFLYVSLYFSCSGVIFFSFLPVVYLCWDDNSFSFSSFSSPPPHFSHNPSMFFPKENLRKAKRNDGSFNSSDLLCVVCCFLLPYSLSSTHTLPNLDTGQVGGIYYSMMSLMDSVLSVMDSWDCRKKDECCAQCSCLVCRNPQLF